MHRILAAHADVARVALGALAGRLPVGVRYGLGGGNGLLAHQVTSRPTQDVDLFIGALEGFPEAAALIDEALASAGYKVVRPGDDGLNDWWPEAGEESGIADREVTSPDGHVTQLEIGQFDLLADPVVIDGMQVAGLDDLAGHKACALVNRRQLRDYGDVAGLVVVKGYSTSRLLSLALERDPALDPDDITAVGAHLDVLPDGRLTPFLPAGLAVTSLRDALAAWPRPGRLTPASPGRPRRLARHGLSRSRPEREALAVITARSAERGARTYGARKRATSGRLPDVAMAQGGQADRA